MKIKHLLSICTAGMLSLQPSADAFAITPKVKALVTLTAGIAVSAAYLKFVYNKNNKDSEAFQERAIRLISQDLTKEVDNETIGNFQKDYRQRIIIDTHKHLITIKHTKDHFFVQYKDTTTLTLTPAQESLLKDAFPGDETFKIFAILERTLPNNANSREVFNTLREAIAWNLVMPVYALSPCSIRNDALKLANRSTIKTLLTGIGLGGALMHVFMKS